MNVKSKELGRNYHIKEVKISKGPLKHWHHIYVKRHSSVRKRRHYEERVCPLSLLNPFLFILYQSLRDVNSSHDLVWRELKILHLLQIGELDDKRGVEKLKVVDVQNILILHEFDANILRGTQTPKYLWSLRSSYLYLTDIRFEEKRESKSYIDSNIKWRSKNLKYLAFCFSKDVCWGSKMNKLFFLKEGFLLNIQ